MPRKLYTESGDEIEVPTDEELAELKGKDGKIEELQKKIDELSLDEGNRNWKPLREAVDKYKKILKEKGFEVDEGGDIKSTPMTAEEVDKIVATKLNKALIDEKFKQAVSSLDEDKQKVVKSYFDKLTAGEELTPENVAGYLEGSLRAAIPGSEANPILKAVAAGSGTGSPIGEGGGSSFAETEAGKGLAAELGMTLETPKNN